MHHWAPPQQRCSPRWRVHPRGGYWRRSRPLARQDCPGWAFRERSRRQPAATTAPRATPVRLRPTLGPKTPRRTGAPPDSASRDRPLTLPPGLPLRSSQAKATHTPRHFLLTSKTTSSSNSGVILLRHATRLSTMGNEGERTGGTQGFAPAGPGVQKTTIPSVPHSPRPLFRPTYWKRGWAWGREQDEGRAL